MKTAVRVQSRARWWAYLPAVCVLALFAFWGWGEGGLRAAGLYLLLLLLCVIQLIYPTLLVWWLLSCPFSMYAVAVAITPQSGPYGRKAVPAGTLVFGRPRTKVPVSDGLP